MPSLNPSLLTSQQLSNQQINHWTKVAVGQIGGADLKEYSQRDRQYGRKDKF
jgi:hypothetical protein